MLASLGRTLREARLRLGLTQQDLAARAGLSGGMVSAVELGKINVTIETLTVLAESVGKELVVDLEEPLSLHDRELLLRVKRLLPTLDPALKATLRLLVAGWEDSSSSDRQENVKTG